MQILEDCPLGAAGTPVAVIGNKAPRGAVLVDALRYAAAQKAGWIGAPPPEALPEEAPKPPKRRKKGGAS